MIYQIGQPLGMNSECIMKVRTAETNIGLTIWMLCVILFTFSSEVPIELSQSERALPKNRRKRFRKKIRILVRTLKSKHDHESVLHRRKEQQNVLRGLSLCSSNRAPLPPTGLGSPWGVRRGTARTRGTFFVKTFQKMVGNVLHEGPGMGQNGVAPWSTMYPQPGNSV